MFMGNKQIKEIRFGKLGGSQSLFLSSRGARPFFDVLSHGNKEALLSDFGKPPVACITKPMKFFGVSEAALNCKNFPFLQSLANGHCEITGIQSDFLYLESEPVDLSIQPFKIWHRIMNVSRRYVHIRDKIVLSVNGSVVQVEEPFGFSISNHITAVRVR